MWFGPFTDDILGFVEASCLLFPFSNEIHPQNFRCTCIITGLIIQYCPSCPNTPSKSKYLCKYGCFLNSGTPKSSILIGFSIINHPFWGTPIFGNTHITDTTINHFTKHSTSDWTGGVGADFLAPGLHLCCQDDLTELGGLAKHPAANIIKSFAERKPCVD